MRVTWIAKHLLINWVFYLILWIFKVIFFSPAKYILKNKSSRFWLRIQIIAIDCMIKLNPSWSVVISTPPFFLSSIKKIFLPVKILFVFLTTIFLGNLRELWIIYLNEKKKESQKCCFKHSSVDTGTYKYLSSCLWYYIWSS